MCVFVCARILVKEVLIDKCNLTFAGAEYILYDLNTTIEMPASESEEQGFDIEKTVEECKYKLTAYTTSAMAFNREIDSVVNYIDTKLINIPATLSNIRYVLEPSDHVIDFAGFVKEADIPFYMFQLRIKTVFYAEWEMKHCMSMSYQSGTGICCRI